MAAADAWFNRIRQVAPVYSPMWTHWRHLANTIELVLPSAHPSPQPKWQIDRFSCFCAAYGRKFLYFTMGGPSPKIAPYHGEIWTHLIHDSLGQSEPTIQRASRSVQLFSHIVLYNGPPLTPSIAVSHGGSVPQSNTKFPGPTRVLNSNAISIGSAFFCRAQ